ncbi:MAG TPA: PPOX class F420-dependent oxidoreductase [Acidimicrobiia bacterium]|nr:PPOX class F420-dependent oxidoreductase [Acidimicrobiia bacterium]
MALSDEKYLLLTTFKRDGTPVSSAVWAVPLDGGSIGFWTSSGSGKVKRLAHTARVTVQPCDGRGRPKAGSATVEGTARVVSGPELEAIRARVVAKYGFMTKLTKVLNAIGGTIKRKRIPYGDRGVVITPAA